MLLCLEALHADSLQPQKLPLILSPFVPPEPGPGEDCPRAGAPVQVLALDATGPDAEHLHLQGGLLSTSKVETTFELRETL